MTTNDQASLQKVLDFVKWARDETREYWALSHDFMFYSTQDNQEVWSIRTNMDAMRTVQHETIQELAAVLDVLKEAVIKTLELKELNKRANCKMLGKD